MNLDDTVARDATPFVLPGDSDITVTAVWERSRRARWKAFLSYTSFDLVGTSPSTLHSRVVADGYTDPGEALDALVTAAEVTHISLGWEGPPVLALHAYSTDGTPVTYPRGRGAGPRPGQPPRLGAGPRAAPGAQRLTSRSGSAEPTTGADLTPARPPRHGHRAHEVKRSPCQKTVTLRRTRFPDTRGRET